MRVNELGGFEMGLNGMDGFVDLAMAFFSFSFSLLASGLITFNSLYKVHTLDYLFRFLQSWLVANYPSQSVLSYHQQSIKFALLMCVLIELTVITKLRHRLTWTLESII
jgi:hypothetical protein